MNLTLFHVSYLDLFEDINLEIETSGLYYLYGKSGSGKTTFLHLLANLINDYEGEILINGKSFKSQDFNLTSFYLNTVGIMFQNHYFLEEYTVNEQLKILRYSQNEIDQILKRVGLYHLKDTKIKYLSLGQSQRLSMCTIYLSHPPLILLDEPTATLDYHNIELLKEIILELSQDSLILIATHQKEIYEKYCDGMLTVSNHQLQIEVTHEKHLFHSTYRSYPFTLFNHLRIYLYHFLHYFQIYFKMLLCYLIMLSLLFSFIYIHFSFNHFFITYQKYFPDLCTLEVENIDESELQEVSFDDCIRQSYFNCEYNVVVGEVEEGKVEVSSDIKDETIMINDLSFQVSKQVENELVNNTVYLSRNDYLRLSSSNKDGYIMLFDSFSSLKTTRDYLVAHYCDVSNNYIDLVDHLKSISHTIDLYLLFLICYCGFFSIIILIYNQRNILKNNEKEMVLFYLNGMSQKKMIIFYLLEMMLYFIIILVLFILMIPMIIKGLKRLCTKYLFKLALLASCKVFLRNEGSLFLLILMLIVFLFIIIYTITISAHFKQSISKMIKEEEGC